MHTQSVSSLNPSPKRKRDAPLVPQLNTATPPRTTTAADESSPHSIVADQLRELRIKPPIPILDFGQLAENAMDVDARKRQKHDAGSNADGFSDIPIRGGPVKQNNEDTITVAANADETTGSEASNKSHVPSSVAAPLDSDALDGVPKDPEEVNTDIAPPAVKSGPSRTKSPSPPPLSLTWQDSEITGHLVDPSQDPEDDGEGLNGIGFRPTPAIAYARSQQRRRQVNEWRAREAREARQKRSDRRRRGVGTSSPAREDANTQARRTVRFAA